MVTQLAYAALIGLVALERLAELVVSRRNAAWSFARGGQEHGKGHWPYMVALHVALLVACPVEVWALDRPFVPWLGLCALGLVIAAQGLRWWCIATLGRQWNTKVIVVPGLARVQRGPYRLFAHPNYVVVALEGLALPLVHTAWLTALGFSLLNGILLTARIRCEDEALASLETADHG